MENEPIIAAILDEYKALLALKPDSSELIHDKLRLISGHIQRLINSGSDHNQVYEQATTLVESALSTEYIAFRRAVSNVDKEQALVQLKHKAAEMCQLIKIF